ncbi:hypothetical protein SAMN02799624_03039 [Paenibacillus sp. UNC496MF]|uniref:hypothetical protein n=1 Tax=Paenibacillus sp. UNC496MF TaxID=1502753 RepID=UPI0008E041DE|nr:hypothetical protein [Paenibacillus sp. UNC496MF]SFJ02194.1 hypothetical protein SAMN02799624_03039 [Paenibacillus sp. UNC496MF]
MIAGSLPKVRNHIDTERKQEDMPGSLRLSVSRYEAVRGRAAPMRAAPVAEIQSAGTPGPDPFGTRPGPPPEGEAARAAA